MRWNCHSAKGCYYESLPDWDWVVKSFRGGVYPTDIDGMVEINGHFLFIEQKKAGAPLPAGQTMALRRLAEQPNTTVLLLRDVTDGSSDMEWITLVGKARQHWVWEQVPRRRVADYLITWYSFSRVDKPRAWEYT
jgi:hypothetical protein